MNEIKPGMKTRVTPDVDKVMRIYGRDIDWVIKAPFENYLGHTFTVAEVFEKCCRFIETGDWYWNFSVLEPDEEFNVSTDEEFEDFLEV